ncbi:LPXTG cell wall anchor domain-containing protein [Lactobacillus delbrueckii]
MPQTGESQDKSAFLAGIVALLASASFFVFGRRKKSEK